MLVCYKVILTIANVNAATVFSEGNFTSRFLFEEEEEEEVEVIWQISNQAVWIFVTDINPQCGEAG